MEKRLRVFSVLGLVAMLFITLVAASPATLPAPGTPRVAATAESGELSVTWGASQGAQFYMVGWANLEEVAQMTGAGREWADAFHFVTIPAQYTSHEIAGLKPDTAYLVIIGASNTRYGGSGLTWSPWSQPATTAGQHGAGFCPITGLQIPEGGYLAVGDTQRWTDATFKLTSATSPETNTLSGIAFQPNEGDRYLELCGTAYNGGGLRTFLAGYDNNLSTDAGIGFVEHTEGADWLDAGLIAQGATVSACDLWMIPEAATTAVYAVLDTASEAVLFRIDLTALSETAAAPAAEPPIAQPVAAATQRHIAEKRVMLDLINAEREKAGVPPVTLGANVAAQYHAESNAENCVTGHWGVDGLTPYMRYSLAGGYQGNAENASGYRFCATSSDNYTPIADITDRVRKHMDGYMASEGHRENLLGPHHRKVNIGLAWNRYQLWSVQHFEGDYFDFHTLPAISGDTLTFSGSTKNGARWADDLAPQIYHHEPPHALSHYQLSQTRCYEYGEPAAFLRPPPPPGSFYPNVPTIITVTPNCRNPYHYPAEAPQAGFPVAVSVDAFEHTSVEWWITASSWRETQQSISATVDVGSLLDRNGPGVYSLLLWGYIDDDPVVVAEYSIFHGVTPPDTYGSNGE